MVARYISRISGSGREDPNLRAVHNEFDLEIEMVAMAQNKMVTHEADLDMHHDSGLRNGNVTDVPQKATHVPGYWYVGGLPMEPRSENLILMLIHQSIQASDLR